MTGKNIDITYGLSNEQISFTYSYGTRYVSIPSFENLYSYYSMSELVRYLASIEYANQNYQSFYEETNGTGKYSSFLSNNYSYYYNFDFFLELKKASYIHNHLLMNLHLLHF